MIITVEELRKQVNCDSVPDELIITRLEAIESVIRAYTNNNFQQRGIRFVGKSEGFYMYGSPRNFAEGDTVQVSGSELNDGLYVVEEVAEDRLKLNRHLLISPFNLVTKIEYPADVVQCAIDLFSWKQTNGAKVGIKSETISRHSVTYEDSGTLYLGYPVGILNGLRLYKKVRC